MWNETAWINNCAYNRIPVFTIFETNSEIIFSAIIPCVVADSLDIQLTDEVVFIKGEQLKSAKDDEYYKLEFGSSQFQSIIPLPKLIQSQTAIARLKLIPILFFFLRATFVNATNSMNGTSFLK
jgi:HSP20 family molecular chaperone IbpA